MDRSGIVGWPLSWVVACLGLMVTSVGLSLSAMTNAFFEIGETSIRQSAIDHFAATGVWFIRLLCMTLEGKL